jgi:hypothetical protein
MKWQIYQYDNDCIDGEDELLETVGTLNEAFKFDNDDYKNYCKIMKIPFTTGIVYPQPNKFVNLNSYTQQQFDNPGENTELNLVHLSVLKYKSGHYIIDSKRIYTAASNWRYAKKVNS